jgi:hypothetical protein
VFPDWLREKFVKREMNPVISLAGRRLRWSVRRYLAPKKKNAGLNLRKCVSRFRMKLA